MERIKRKKSKFPCLFGGNEDNPKRKTVQYISRSRDATQPCLFKFGHRKTTSKQCKEISNKSSSKKRARNILAKLMGRRNVNNILNDITVLNASNSNANSLEFCYGGYVAPSRIILDKNDRLTRSTYNISESSLIMEAKNIMSERWKTTHDQKDFEMVNKCHEVDRKEKTVKGNFNCGEDSSLKKLRYDKRCQPKLDTNSSWVDEDSLNSEEPLTAKSVGTDSIQLSEPEPEFCEHLNVVDHTQFSVPEVPPTQDESFDPDCFERINSQLEELKKQIELLTMMSRSTSNHHITVPEPASWEYKIFKHTLQVLYISSPDPQTYMYTFDHTNDQRLFQCLEKYYLQETILSRPEKHIFYDDIETKFFRVSKSTVWYSWEGNAEDFFVIDYDKDPEWLRPTNQVDILAILPKPGAVMLQ